MKKTIVFNYSLSLMILILISASISQLLWMNLDVTLFGDILKYLNYEKLTKKNEIGWKPFTNFIIISNIFIRDRIDLFGLIYVVFLLKAMLFYFCISHIENIKIKILGILFLITSPHNLVFEFVITKEFLFSMVLIFIVFLNIKQIHYKNTYNKDLIKIKFIEYFLLLVLIKLKFFFIILFTFKFLYDLYSFLKNKTNFTYQHSIFLIFLSLLLICSITFFFIPPVLFNETLLLKIFAGYDPVLLSTKEGSRLQIENGCLYCSKIILNVINFIVFSVVDLKHLNYPLIWIFIIENTLIKLIILYFLFLNIKNENLHVIFLILLGIIGSTIPYCLLNTGAALRYWGAINDPMLLTICYFYFLKNKSLLYK